MADLLPPKSFFPSYIRFRCARCFMVTKTETSTPRQSNHISFFSLSFLYFLSQTSDFFSLTSPTNHPSLVVSIHSSSVPPEFLYHSLLDGVITILFLCPSLSSSLRFFSPQYLSFPLTLFSLKLRVNPHNDRN